MIAKSQGYEVRSNVPGLKFVVQGHDPKNGLNQGSITVQGKATASGVVEAKVPTSCNGFQSFPVRKGTTAATVATKLLNALAEEPALVFGRPSPTELRAGMLPEDNEVNWATFGK